MPGALSAVHLTHLFHFLEIPKIILRAQVGRRRRSKLPAITDDERMHFPESRHERGCEIRRRGSVVPGLHARRVRWHDVEPVACTQRQEYIGCGDADPDPVDLPSPLGNRGQRFFTLGPELRRLVRVQAHEHGVSRGDGCCTRRCTFRRFDAPAVGLIVAGDGVDRFEDRYLGDHRGACASRRIRLVSDDVRHDGVPVGNRIGVREWHAKQHERGCDARNAGSSKTCFGIHGDRNTETREAALAREGQRLRWVVQAW